MSSFDEYYKKWKKEKGVTTDTSYRNLTNEQKAQEALKDVDEIFKNYNSTNNTNTQKQILNSNQANNNLNIFNNSKNTSNMLKQDTYRNQSIWDKVNNLAFGNRTTSYKENNKRNTINYTQEKTTNNGSNKTIWDIVNQKGNQISSDNSMLYANNNMPIVPIERGKQEKNEDLWKDVKDLAGLVMLGTSSGSKQTLNYIESANEKIFSNYKNIKEQQFLNSNNVSEEDKALAKSQNNPLLQMNGINIDNKIETNLVKKAIRESIAKDEQEIAKTQDRISNPIMSKLGEVAPSMGQILPGTALNALAPGAGISYFVPSAGGGYINDALNRGMSEEQAFKYGSIMGLLEGASDSFITGQQVNKVSNAFNGKQVLSKKVLDSYGFNIFENAFQESIMEPAQEITAGIIGDKADWSNMGERMLQSGFNGALMGAISNGVTYGLEKSGEVYNKIKNGENIIPQEYKDALRENISKFGRKKVEESLRKGSTDVYNELNNVINNQQNISNQSTTKEQNNIVSNINIEPIHSNYNETAKRYNIDINNDTVKGMYEVASKRGINIYYDDSVFSSSKQNAKWVVDSKGNRTVVINPNCNTDTTLQSIMIHELTHDIEGSSAYSKINEMILNKLKQSDNYDNMMIDIANTYKNEYSNMSKEEFSKMIEQEAIADYLGENLGNQEFVNELVKSQDKNTIQKIMDWVKNKITSLKNTVTGNEETNYWNKIKDNFEKAYNQEFQRNDIVEKFSIQTDSNGNQYVKVDTDQDIFEGKSISEQNKIAKKYILEKFREKGLKYDGENIKVSTKTANEYTHPKVKLPFKTKQSKIRASTELDNILNISKYEYSSSDDGRHSFAKDGWDYYRTTFEVDGIKFEGLINIAKSGDKRTFYDMTNIKRISQNRSASDKSFSTSLANSNKSILPTKEDVNRNTTKYSMKESENNSGSFNLLIKKESKQTNGNWQQYLKDTSINKGTRETIKDIKLPITEQYKNSNEIKNNNKELIKNENMNEKVTRHDTIQKYRELARENIKNISTWKDKSNGLKYQLETMERNMYDIIPDKAEAQKMNDTYFEPIHKAEAEKQKFINKYNNKIKEYNLNKYESEAVQFLGEQKYNPSHKTEDAKEIVDRINKNIEKGKIDETKVNNAIETFRQIYDELFEIENNTLRKYGYQEKPYRKGYFPHFIDYVPTTKTEKVLDKLGFKVDKRSLPTDIAGITEQFVPGKTWNQSALERKTDKTDYNALKGFDTYIQQASDNIFHTEDIQKLRGLENEIRYQYSEKGIQNRIDEILKNETLFQEEKQDLIDKIFAEINNPMPNLVTELRRYTNALANKKSEADRSIEQSAGREIYNTINAIEGRFGANAVGLNIGSAVTNFIPITQAYSQISTKNMGRAFIDTVKSYVKDDGFVDKSTFLTNRLNQSEKLYKTNLEKISDKTSFLFNAIDEVTSNIVVRGKYLENISEGMNETEALKNADGFARNVIADRSKGALPTKFEEKNPLTKMFTQFQLEVNNQYRYMFKDIPRDLKDKGTARIALAFFKMFVGAYLYNEVSEEVTGRKSAFSPIDLAISSYQNITDSDMKTFDKISNISTDIGEQLPFIGGLLGGGKVPVNGAIPDAGNLLKAGTGLVTGEMDSKKAKDIIGKEVSKPLYYILPPFGGGQIKKSIEGIQTIKEGGSYGIDNKGQKILKFPVENASASDYIKAGVFGKYALPLAKEYTNNKYKSLNAKETQGYLSTKIPYKEFLTYTNSKLTKKDDKIKFINNMNITEQQKWDMYCYDIFESETRKKDGGSQLEDAKYAIKNGISKKEYINLYNETKKREIDMPTQEEGKELIKQGIKIKNYIDYSIKSHDETKKQKKKGTIKENGQLKSKDKINILLNSNYSEKEKKAIYANYINKEDKKIILVDKLNFPLEQYLKYKQQGFKSEKDDEGESISGSKKKKVYNYLNEINDTDLSLDYKKVICKIEGISSYDKDIVNFVNSQNNLTKTERIEILKNIGFKVDKEGRIKTTTMLPLTRFVK